MSQDFSTPMMQQYMNIKKQYEDCLLFFRLGDFYELFLQDAIIGAKVLDIVLTARPRGKDGDIPMAGVPFHAANAYIAKLVKAGYKVAICEQVSEPDKKGIVERDVVRIVTPGTILDEKTLSAKEHNYTMSLSLGDSSVGLAFADVSTGDFQTTEINYGNNLTQVLANEISHFRPAECILSSEDYNNSALLKILRAERDLNLYNFLEWNEHAYSADKKLKKQFNVKTLRSFGLINMEKALEASGALLGYIAHTQKNNISHMKALRTYTSDEYVVLDASTISNLELFNTIRESDEKGSFIHCIDETETPMGGRLLRNWVKQPLRNKKSIEARLMAVESLMHERSLRDKTKTELRQMYDIERILSRLSVGIGNPHDLINLSKTLQNAVTVHQYISLLESQLIQDSLRDMQDGRSIVDTIQNFISPDSPLDPKTGGVIKSGVDTKLDMLRENIREAQEWIAKLEARERERTGIGSLKVKFNNVFGYFIEISKSNVHLAPADYIRKQTTVNGERFITSELQEYEDIVLRGQDLINGREYELFLNIVSEVLSQIQLLQKIANDIATIDCLITFATIAERDHYVRPALTTDGIIKIHDGRHPVVERIQDTSFVPNDTVLNHSDQQLLVITGPNMAGKSVYMRQVALIVLMAHIGSFVPARRASISLVDRIFVRSGASDSIGRGLSTFMVEMVETAYILHHATKDSLIIMDEIGRGTSTYDGISIAWAIAEHLVTHPEQSAKTLFATHYHELQDLEHDYPDHIKNYHMAIEESSGTPIFLYRLTRGGALGSYAIAVARLAGLPQPVTTRAQELLKRFTHTDNTSS